MVELCRVIEGGHSAKEPTGMLSGSSRGEKEKANKAAIDSDLDEEQTFVGSEDKLGASRSDWKMNVDSKPGTLVDKDELLRFTIQTRTHSATLPTVNAPEDPMGADEEYLAHLTQQLHGTKRKAERDPSKPLYRSPSNLVVEVQIMAPSPKKKRL